MPLSDVQVLPRSLLTYIVFLSPVLQVLGTRKKLSFDLCERLEFKAIQASQTEAWQLLTTPGSTASLVVEAFLKAKLMPLAAKDAEYYNENRPLGETIQEAVEVVAILDGWVDGLRAVAEGMTQPLDDLLSSTEPVVLNGGSVGSSQICHDT